MNANFRQIHARLQKPTSIYGMFSVVPKCEIINAEMFKKNIKSIAGGIFGKSQSYLESSESVLGVELFVTCKITAKLIKCIDGTTR